jgi:hypothetical protein
LAGGLVPHGKTGSLELGRRLKKKREKKRKGKRGKKRLKGLAQCNNTLDLSSKTRRSLKERHSSP